MKQMEPELVLEKQIVDDEHESQKGFQVTGTARTDARKGNAWGIQFIVEVDSSYGCMKGYDRT